MLEGFAERAVEGDPVLLRHLLAGRRGSQRHGLDHTTLYWNRQGWVNTSLGEIIHIEGTSGFREVPINLKSWMVPIITHPTKSYWRSRGYWRFLIRNEAQPMTVTATKAAAAPSVLCV